MPDLRITELTPLFASQLTDADQFAVVDVNDTTQSPTGTTKSLDLNNLKINLRNSGFTQAPSGGAEFEVPVYNAQGELVSGSTFTFDGSILTVGSVTIPSTGNPSQGSDVVTLDYFNANLPAPGIPDAPSDGNQYARQDGGWSVVAGGGGGIPEAPQDGQDYVRNNAAWQQASYFSGDWGDLTGIPAEFPPADHTHLIADITDFTDNSADWDTAFGWGDHALAGYLTTETDPTVPADVKAITSTQIGNWDDAFSWGNHANFGYLTSESDPTVPAHVKAITTQQITNWEQAFIWGDHAAQNYLQGITNGPGISIDQGAIPRINFSIPSLPQSTQLMAGTDFLVAYVGTSEVRTPPSFIPLSLFLNDVGFTTNEGDITAVNAGSGLSGGGLSGAVTISLPTTITAGTYGSTNSSTKINNITVNAHGQVTAITTGGTGDITAVNAGTGLTGGGVAGSVTLSLGQHNHTASEIVDFTTAVNNVIGTGFVSRSGDTMTGRLNITGNAQPLHTEGTGTKAGLSSVNFHVHKDSAGTNLWYLGMPSASHNDLILYSYESTNALRLNQGGKMNYNGDVDFDGDLTLGDTSTGSQFTIHKGDGAAYTLAYENNYLRWRRGGGGTAAGWRWDNFDTEAMRLTTQGDLVVRQNVTADDFILSSDERHKKNIEDMEQLGWPVKFKTFTMAGRKRWGVIAQEVEKVNPHWVHTNKDGYKSVSYIDMLCAKIHELEIRVRHLQLTRF